MSYQMHLIDQRFTIKTGRFVQSWKVLLVKEYGVTHDFMGVHRPRTLVDEGGNVKGVEWDSATSEYHLEEFLKDIAPYVHYGSYLKFHDQYGDLTIYRFRSGEVKIETIGMKDGESGMRA